MSWRAAHRTAGLVPLLVAAGACLVSGCLDPLVSDEVERTEAILPAGTEVAGLESRPSLAARIDANDFIDGAVIELRSGFRDGAPVRYWDFGASPADTQPLYLLVRAADDGPLETPQGRFVPVGHPPIWNVVPGDPAYSPLWRVQLLPVGADWADQVLPSFEAVEQARALGLVGDPIETPMVINCPVVAAGVRLAELDGTLREPSMAYYRGVRVPYFDVGMVDLGPDARALVGDIYVLRREGGEPLSEPMRGVDITGDGDLADSNDIFASAGEARVGLFRRHSVVVPQAYASIDTLGDDTSAEYRAVTDLFDAGGAARPEHVVATYPGEEICNCPLPSTP